MLEAHDVRISMDGKGCYQDNIFVERLWRSVKYECVYLKAFGDSAHLREKLKRYFTWFNKEQPIRAWTMQHPMRCTSQPLIQAA
ncbi:integrase core domain-containing protein [Halomonas elongata]|uniref:integrase core domain-containing protein n=1 Tax=Halomonas elongata TaxID=2746 RepID=UPI0038D40A35